MLTYTDEVDLEELVQMMVLGSVCAHRSNQIHVTGIESGTETFRMCPLP